MTKLAEAVALGRDDHGLAVVSTLRSDGTIQSTLVNAGMLDHPATGTPVLAFVTYGKVKLANLRARPQVTTTFRNGWQWSTVEGAAQLAGPDDPAAWLDAEGLRLLLRAVFVPGRRPTRRLARIRPRHGGAAAYGRPCRAKSGVQQLAEPH